jgi:hypothetical protein
MRENDKSKNDRCGFYFHSLNRICSGTTEIEWWIRENDISGNDRSRFHCIINVFLFMRQQPLICPKFELSSHVEIQFVITQTSTPSISWNKLSLTYGFNCEEFINFQVTSFHHTKSLLLLQWHQADLVLTPKLVEKCIFCHKQSIMTSKFNWFWRKDRQFYFYKCCSCTIR